MVCSLQFPLVRCLLQMTVEEKVRGFGPLAEDLRRRGAARARFISTLPLKETTALRLSCAPPFELAVDWWFGVERYRRVRGIAVSKVSFTWTNDGFKRRVFWGKV